MSYDHHVSDHRFGCSPVEKLEGEQVTAINLTKNCCSSNEEQVCKTPQNYTLLNLNNHTPGSAMSGDGNIRNSPYLTNEQENPLFRDTTCHNQVHQGSITEMNSQETTDLNNNTKLPLESDNSQSYITKSIEKGDGHSMNIGVSPAPTPTSFGGLFPHVTPQEYNVPVPSGGSDIDIYRQSYLHNGYSQQQFTEGSKQQQLVANLPQQQQQIVVDSTSQVSGFGQYSQYGPTLDDEQIAAEQLASELCSNYGGSNSHMISDILKRNGGQNYTYGGFERPNDIESMQQFDNMVANQHVIHDVDLLNTPQQLPVDEDSQGVLYRSTRQQEQFGDPRASSTPQTYKRHRPVEAPQDYQTSVTYNDVHLHGGRWSSQKSPMIEQHPDPESPFPPARQKNTAVEYHDKKPHESYQTGLAERGQYSQRTPKQQSDMSPSNEGRNFLNMPQFQHTPVRECGSSGGNQHVQDTDQYNAFKSPSSHNSSYGQPQHEVTKMTFTPREMMETHLSQNYRYQKKSSYGQHVSDYSSIYPSREFIEKATSQKNVKREQNNRVLQETLHPKKRARTSKYSTDDVPKVPPQMPIFDSMFQKYAPIIPRDEIHGGKHKYFVVNPSEITNMASRSLITKYIDFLILENEQITEISKSTNPPVDIYVTEDMYFMDSIKFNAPFPSKKFVEWVASFYPRLNFFEMKFKGKHPKMPQEGKSVKPDTRPTQQILEDTFYFFQREAMNLESQKI
ncbi:uncharacterized protein LOC123527557 [Mercenaria mercenaria]|uniref:uncharacterized protein LOC123527557 n=1 Tax=Mercenaria mercenaria TaxID=6596 RepID=UPI00234E760C|nr:uncharacterized protein LOC123527557 [Mercenaria mercenaria]XP_045163025.2 uncharacterized protein LOC123527557 [Mercenaria mercenaria]